MHARLKLVAQTAYGIIGAVAKALRYLLRIACKILMLPFVLIFKCCMSIVRNTHVIAAIAVFCAPALLMRVPVLVSYAKPQMCNTRIHSSHVTNIYNSIPVHVKGCIATAFIQERYTSQYSCVLLYGFMRDVCDALHNNKKPGVLDVAFTTQQLSKLRELSYGYNESGFDAICTPEFVEEFCSTHTINYIVRKLYARVKEDLVHLSSVRARPWLCIVRNTLCAASFKNTSASDRQVFLCGVADAIRRKKSLVVIEDSMYELQVGEGVSGKRISAERHAQLTKIVEGRMRSMDELGHSTAYLLSRIAQLMSFEDAVKRSQISTISSMI
jgi:hypothetical protein